jgi:hypothetical protein
MSNPVQPTRSDARSSAPTAARRSVIGRRMVCLGGGLLLACGGWASAARADDAGQAAAQAIRPTVADARDGVHAAFDNYVDVTKSTLAIGSCRAGGRRSRVCTVRIAGGTPQRYRVVVTERAEDYQVHATLMSGVATS